MGTDRRSARPTDGVEDGQTRKHTRRQVADAIFYVAATGCQWRHLPERYPPWSTVHSYHLDWSRNGPWEKVCDRLRNMVCLAEGRDAEPSAGIIDARTVRGAPTVTTTHPRHSELTRGYDGNKKISGRKLFGLVDTIGLLVGVRVVAAGVSDNAGGIAVFDLARPKTDRLDFLESGQQGGRGSDSTDVGIDVDTFHLVAIDGAQSDHLVVAFSDQGDPSLQIGSQAVWCVARPNVAARSGIDNPHEGFGSSCRRGPMRRGWPSVRRCC